MINRALSAISKFIATCAYIGYIPLAPGTMASLAAFVVGTIFYSQIPLFVIGSLLAGLLVCKRVECDSLKKDPSFFVMDEFCGMMIALWAIPQEMVFGLVAFILFRLFDIVKPWPIILIQRRKGPTSIMWDDVVAGIFANVATQTLTFLF